MHRDAAWLLTAVSELSDLHEQRRPAPWAVTDAPESFIAQRLRGIVGVEVAIERIEAKAKRSQNRSEEDRRRVIEGLGQQGGARERLVAEQMERDLR